MSKTSYWPGVVWLQHATACAGRSPLGAHLRHMVEPGIAALLPSGQGVHSVAPGALEYVPAWQAMQLV